MRAMLAENWDPKIGLEAYVNDVTYCFEQKLDGQRLLAGLQDGQVVAYNRNGEISQHLDMLKTEPWSHNFDLLRERDLLLDGELVDKVFHVFDIPYLQGIITTESGHHYRKYILSEVFRLTKFNSNFALVATAYTPKTKTELTLSCRDNGAEGIIIKKIDAPYVEGRSENMLKVKFTKDADVVVTRTNTKGKINATLSVFDEHGQEVEIGRSSLIGKEDISTGDVVEVRYLYISDKQRLVQPRIKRKRTDKSPQECSINQFKQQNTRAVIQI